jgi:hypothetical protein
MTIIKKSLIVSFGLLIAINSHASWYYPNVAQRAVAHIKRHKVAYAVATVAVMITTGIVARKVLSSRRQIALERKNQDFWQRKHERDMEIMDEKFRANEILDEEKELPSQLKEESDHIAQEILREEFSTGGHYLDAIIQQLTRENYNYWEQFTKHDIHIYGSHEQNRQVKALLKMYKKIREDLSDRNYMQQD